MKMRTKLAAWGTALLMMASTVLPSTLPWASLFTTTAYADAVNAESGTTATSSNSSIATPWAAVVGYKVYFAPSDSMLHDGDEDKNYSITLNKRIKQYADNTSAGRAMLNTDINPSTTNYVAFFPSYHGNKTFTDGEVPSDYYTDRIGAMADEIATIDSSIDGRLQASCNEAFVKWTWDDTVEADYFKVRYSNVSVLIADKINGKAASGGTSFTKDSVPSNVVLGDDIKSVGDWSKIFDDGKTLCGSTVSVGDYDDAFKAYRQKVDFSSQVEFDNLVKPLAQRMGSATLADVTSRFEKGENISIIIEPLMPISYNNRSNLVYTTFNQMAHWASNLGFLSETWAPFHDVLPDYDTVSSPGTWAYAMHFYLDSNAFAMASRPAYSPEWNLSGEESKTLQSFGWAYYNVCNNPADEQRVNIGVAKTFEATCDDDTLTESELRQLATQTAGNAKTKFSVTAPMNVDHILATFNTIDPASLIELVGSGTPYGIISNIVNRVKLTEQVDWVINAGVTAAEGSKVDASFKFNEDVPYDEDATYMMIAVETSCVYPEAPNDRISITRDSGIGGAFLFFNPKSGWTCYSFSNIFPNMAEFKLFSSSPMADNEASVALVCTNRLKATKIPEEEEEPIKVPSLTAEGVVVDIDNYWAVGYPEEFGFVDNKQLVYTKSSIETKDNRYQLAFSMNTDDATIASDMSTLIKQLSLDLDDTVTDAEILQAPVPNTKYTREEKYDYYVNIINPLSSSTLNKRNEDKHSFKVEADYIKAYDVLLEGNLNSVAGIPDVSNDEYSGYETISSLEIGNWGVVPSADLLTPGKTYTFETKDKMDTTIDDIEDKLTKYTEYCRDYAIYEAMVGASANSIAEAMQYWTKAAYLVYSDLVDLRNTELENPDVEDFDSSSSDCTSHGYYYTWWCSHSHDNYSKSAAEASDTVCLNEANAIKSKLDPLVDKLHDITGWKLAYSINYRYHTGRTCSTWCCSSGSDDWRYIYPKIKQINGTYGSATYANRGIGVWFKITGTDGKNKVDVDRVPKAIADIADYLGDIANVSTNTNTLGGIMGNLTTILSDQLAVSAALEDYRPNAEFRIEQDYKTSYNSDYFGEAVVPAYMMTYYWKDPKAFLDLKVTNGLLAAILDFEGSTYGGSNTTSGGIHEIDAMKSETEPLYSALQRMTSVTGKDKLQYVIKDTKGKSTTITRPVYLWAYSDRPYDSDPKLLCQRFTVKLDGDADPTTGANTEKSYSKEHKYRLQQGIATPFGEVIITNFDALSYAYPSLGVWTSIWRLESEDKGETTPNSSNMFIPTLSWLDSYEAVYPKSVAAVNTSKLEELIGSKSDYIVQGTETKVDRGATSVSGKDFAVVHMGSVTDNQAVKTYDKEIQDSIITPDINTDYYYSRVETGKRSIAVETLKSTAASNWYASSTAYELSTKFLRRYSDEKPLKPTFETGSSAIEAPDETPDGTAIGHGSYTRDMSKVGFGIYPFVKVAYYDVGANASNHSQMLKYAFIAGQTQRKMYSNVYYKMGIMGSAVPTVAANAYASSQAALALSKNQFNGSPVTYTGSGLTVSYSPTNLSVAIQTFNLINAETGKDYQAGWDNYDTTNCTAHSEVLNSLGAQPVQITTEDSTYSTMGIPYLAGCELTLANKNGNIKQNAMTLSQGQASVMLQNNTPATAAGQIKLVVEKGELVRVIIPADLKIAVISDRGENIGLDSSYVATGEYEGTSTLNTFTALNRGNASVIVDALRGVGITGTDTCILKTTFAYNEGEAVVKDYNGNTPTELRYNPADPESGWYNEYVSCLALEYECTTYQVQPITFTDKLPIEMGPATPADQSKFFSEGYGLIAEYLLLKIGADPIEAGIDTGIDTIKNNTWRIPRGTMEGGSIVEGETGDEAFVYTEANAKAGLCDIVISNVPVTAAN